MKNILTLLLLTTTVIYSCGQNNTPKPDKIPNEVTTLHSDTINESHIKTATFSRDSYLHTEADYTDSTGNGIIIQNSYPRGGGLIYTAKEFQQYGYAVFWSRIINKTEKTVTLNIQFPADSFLVYPSPHVHFKLLVPPDTMTMDKVSVFSFGLEGVEAFVENNFYEPSQVQRTILPDEASSFYVILLSHLPTADQGVSRTGLFLKEQELFYRLSSPMGVKLIPCGRINFDE